MDTVQDGAHGVVLLGALVLHGVRVLGAPSVGDVARLYDLDPAMVTEHLLDAEAYGWARRHDWFGTTSWSLTERGKAENERRLPSNSTPPTPASRWRPPTAASCR